MTDHNDPFGRHNLDHLHERVASGRPNSQTSTAGTHRTVDAMGLIAGNIEAAQGGNLVLECSREDGNWTAVLTLNNGLTPIRGAGDSHEAATYQVATLLREQRARRSGSE